MPTGTNGDDFFGPPNGGSETYHLLGGNDTVLAGAGNDIAFGGAGNDVLAGEAGNDELNGGAGDDVMTGGAGNDFLDASNAFQIDLTGADRMEGGAGNDTYGIDDLGDVVIELAGGGQDTVRVSITSYTLPETGVEHVEVWDMFLNSGGTLIGNSADNTLISALQSFHLAGGGGDDRVVCRTVFSSNANRQGDEASVLDGGTGSDTLDIIDLVSQVIEDDEGNQTFTYLRDYTFDLTCGDSLEEYFESYAGIENVTSHSGEQTLIGDALANRLSSGAGRDLLYGRAGDDFLLGGGSGDLLYGGKGADALDGGAGNDVLRGGPQQDSLTGGLGADTFVFANGDNLPADAAFRDTVTDFNRSEGDLLDLSGVDADTGLAGDQAFSFIGQQVFHGTAGELRSAVVAEGRLLQGDTDGDAVADFEILVLGDAPSIPYFLL